MILNSRLVGSLYFALMFAAPGAAWSQTAPRDQHALVEFFEKKVRPVLANNCNNCHSANTKAARSACGRPQWSSQRRQPRSGGHSRQSREEPADSGGAENASQGEDAAASTNSRNKKSPTWRPGSRMAPPGRPWSCPPRSPGRVPKYEKLRKDHWAWQPLTEAKAPAVKNPAWARDEIDRFILARLEEKNLHPSATRTGSPSSAGQLSISPACRRPLTRSRPFSMTSRRRRSRSRGSPVGLARLRRTLGPTLARRGSLCGIDRLDEAGCIDLAFRRTLSRPATQKEIARPPSS